MIAQVTDHFSRVGQRRQNLLKAYEQLPPAYGAMTVEIGCGHGHFLAAYACANPTVCAIGLDILAERIARAERKKQHLGLRNLNFIHGSAEDFFSILPAPTRVQQVFILFPDPWPKRRHQKNRLIRVEFLDALSPFVLNETRLYFRTDDVAYFAAAKHEFIQHPHWELAEEAWPFEHETVFQLRAKIYHSLVARPVSTR